MDNQHRKISGYRELSEEEIKLMNDLKALSSEVGSAVDLLRADCTHDQRWVSIGQTHLQQGFMALIRAIAQPETF